MDTKDILKRVDHTALKAFCTWEDIRKLCDEAVACQMASVCIPPNYIRRVHDAYGETLDICTVIGFPLGYSVTSAKVEEARQAVADGAREVDMVINITDVKNGDYDKVEDEFQNGYAKPADKTEQEKIAMCRAVTAAGADYIKTSTGFGSAGAALEDIELFKKYIGPDVKIKAAGGIRTREAMEAFIEAGCDRIGSSSAMNIL